MTAASFDPDRLREFYESFKKRARIEQFSVQALNAEIEDTLRFAMGLKQRMDRTTAARTRSRRGATLMAPRRSM